jgi:hypothetical protein
MCTRGRYHRSRSGPIRPIRKDRSDITLWSIIGVGLIVLLLLVAGCSPRASDEPQMWTGVTLSKLQVQEAISNLPKSSGGYDIIAGQPTYQQVSYDWLVWYQAHYKAQIAIGEFGVTAWSTNFECTSFADGYSYFAQAHYASIARFHNGLGNGIAIGEFWYIPYVDGAKSPLSLPGHAINVCLTDRGIVYLEPQADTFTPVVVTPLEHHYMLHCKFD